MSLSTDKPVKITTKDIEILDSLNDYPVQSEQIKNLSEEAAEFMLQSHSQNMFPKLGWSKIDRGSISVTQWIAGGPYPYGLDKIFNIYSDIGMFSFPVEDARPYKDKRDGLRIYKDRADRLADWLAYDNDNDRIEYVDIAKHIIKTDHSNVEDVWKDEIPANIIKTFEDFKTEDMRERSEISSDFIDDLEDAYNSEHERIYGEEKKKFSCSDIPKDRKMTLGEQAVCGWYTDEPMKSQEEFKEDEHPRDEGGQFSEKEGGGDSGNTYTQDKKVNLLETTKKLKKNLFDIITKINDSNKLDLNRDEISLLHEEANSIRRVLNERNQTKRDEKEEQKLGKMVNGKLQIKEKIPEFSSIKDVKKWVSDMGEKYGGKNRFSTSNVYSEAYPKIVAVYDRENHKEAKQRQDVMKEKGHKVGDVVEYTYVGNSLWQEPYTVQGTIKMDKDGFPYVRGTDKKRYNWHKRFRKMSGESVIVKEGNEYYNVSREEFKEEDHPRGQPDNSGQFVSGSGNKKKAERIRYDRKITSGFTQTKKRALQSLSMLNKRKSGYSMVQMYESDEEFAKKLKEYKEANNYDRDIEVLKNITNNPTREQLKEIDNTAKSMLLDNELDEKFPDVSYTFTHYPDQKFRIHVSKFSGEYPYELYGIAKKYENKELINPNRTYSRKGVIVDIDYRGKRLGDHELFPDRKSRLASWMDYDISDKLRSTDSSTGTDKREKIIEMKNIIINYINDGVIDEKYSDIMKNTIKEFEEQEKNEKTETIIVKEGNEYYEVKLYSHEEFREEDHPRGQPDNSGQFVSGGGGSKSNEPNSEPEKDYKWNGINFSHMVPRQLGDAYSAIEDPSKKEELKRLWNEKVKRGEVSPDMMDKYSFLSDISKEKEKEIKKEVERKLKPPIVEKKDKNGFLVQKGVEVKIGKNIGPKYVEKIKKVWNNMPPQYRRNVKRLKLKYAHGGGQWSFSKQEVTVGVNEYFGKKHSNGGIVGKGSLYHEIGHSNLAYWPLEIQRKWNERVKSTDPVTRYSAEYLHGRQLKAQKNQRNIRKAVAMLETNPDDPYVLDAMSDILIAWNITRSDIINGNLKKIADSDYEQNYHIYQNEQFAEFMAEYHGYNTRKINRGAYKKLKEIYEELQLESYETHESYAGESYKKYVEQKMNVLKRRANENEEVGYLFSPKLHRHGKKIHGTLAYAGISLNNRLYLPEALSKGHNLRLRLLLNHSSTAGAEEELHRLEPEMRKALENGEDYEVGWVELEWKAEELTLYYKGEIEHPFFQKEVDEMDMSVSLGLVFDSNSPQVCDEQCYTVIMGAEWKEVSLVYHPGFPIATIEAMENKMRSNENFFLSNEFDEHKHSRDSDGKFSSGGNLDNVLEKHLAKKTEIIKNSHKNDTDGGKKLRSELLKIQEERKRKQSGLSKFEKFITNKDDTYYNRVSDYLEDNNVPSLSTEEFDEDKHPRGQPDNAGQFAEKEESNIKPKNNTDYSWNGTNFAHMVPRQLGDAYSAIEDPAKKEELKRLWNQKLERGEISPDMMEKYSFLSDNMSEEKKDEIIEKVERKLKPPIVEKKNELGFLVQDGVTVEVSERISKENLEKIAKTWNEIPPERRRNVKILNLKRSIYERGFYKFGLDRVTIHVGSSWGSNDNIGLLYHEIGHSNSAHWPLNIIKEWNKRTKNIDAITDYSESWRRTKKGQTRARRINKKIDHLIKFPNDAGMKYNLSNVLREWNITDDDITNGKLKNMKELYYESEMNMYQDEQHSEFVSIYYGNDIDSLINKSAYNQLKEIYEELQLKSYETHEVFDNMNKSVETIIVREGNEYYEVGIEEFREEDHPRDSDGQFASKYSWNGKNYSDLSPNEIASVYQLVDDPDRKKDLKKEWDKIIQNKNVEDLMRKSHPHMFEQSIFNDASPQKIADLYKETDDLNVKRMLKDEWDSRVEKDDIFKHDRQEWSHMNFTQQKDPDIDDTLDRNPWKGKDKEEQEKADKMWKNMSRAERQENLGEVSEKPTPDISDSDWRNFSSETREYIHKRVGEMSEAEKSRLVNEVKEKINPRVREYMNKRTGWKVQKGVEVDTKQIRNKEFTNAYRDAWNKIPGSRKRNIKKITFLRAHNTRKNTDPAGRYIFNRDEVQFFYHSDSYMWEDKYSGIMEHEIGHSNLIAGWPVDAQQEWIEGSKKIDPITSYAGEYKEDYKTDDGSPNRSTEIKIWTREFLDEATKVTYSEAYDNDYILDVAKDNTRDLRKRWGTTAEDVRSGKFLKMAKNYVHLMNNRYSDEQHADFVASYYKPNYKEYNKEAFEQLKTLRERIMLKYKITEAFVGKSNPRKSIIIKENGRYYEMGTEDFKEHEHPRGGDPENSGRFSEKSGGGNDGDGEDDDDKDDDKKSHLKKRREQYKEVKEFEKKTLENTKDFNGEQLKNMEDMWKYVSRTFSNLDLEPDIYWKVDELDMDMMVEDSKWQNEPTYQDKILLALTEQIITISKDSNDLEKYNKAISIISENSQAFRNLEEKAREISNSVEYIAEKYGIVSRGTTIKELKNFVNGIDENGSKKGEVGAGRESIFGNDFVSTTIRETLAHHMMVLAEDTDTGEEKDRVEDEDGIMIEYDISNLKKGIDWKSITYKAGPDLKYETSSSGKMNRIGENYDDAFQSMNFSHGGEIYLKTGSKPTIKRVKIYTVEMNEKRKKIVIDKIKALGLEDKLEIVDDFNDEESIKKSLKESFNNREVIYNNMENIPNYAKAFRMAEKMSAKSGMNAKNLADWLVKKL